MIRHDCGAIWTGRAAAHCAECHATFGSASAFDAHRRSSGERGACVHPTAAGLVLVGVLWRRPALDAADRDALRKAA